MTLRPVGKAEDPAEDRFNQWRKTVVAGSRFDCRPMPLGLSPSWSHRDGGIRHASNRFFAIVGVEDDEGQTFPLIDQPESGLLAFLVADADGETRWLAQMKVEPGNVGGAQLAPTVQATLSNLDRVHAGMPPPMVDAVLDPAAAAVVSDGAWSEQGTRFLGKRNRNLVARTRQAPVPDNPTHRWVGSGDLRAALRTDFGVNTDARSVIATAPWHLLEKSGDLFEGDLSLSHRQKDPDADALIARALGNRRVPRVRRIGLDALPDAHLDGSATPLRHPHFDVIHRAVRAETREVPEWDQPLVATSGHGMVTLVLRRGPDGVLRALLGVERSAGLTHGAELSATVTAPPGTETPGIPAGERLAEVLVSDEGGRFDHEVTTVVIVIADEDPPVEPAVALTLGDLERIVRRPGLTTNELRTAVALLLSLA